MAFARPGDRPGMGSRGLGLFDSVNLKKHEQRRRHVWAARHLCGRQCFETLARSHARAPRFCPGMSSADWRRVRHLWRARHLYGQRHRMNDGREKASRGNITANVIYGIYAVAGKENRFAFNHFRIGDNTCAASPRWRTYQDWHFRHAIYGIYARPLPNIGA